MSSSTLSPVIPVGARYMLVSALGFAIMAACVKFAANEGIPLLEIVAARALVSIVISYIDVRRKGIPLWGTHRTLLLARGIVGVLALICVYYAVTTLPLAEATLLQYMYPVFTSILGLLVLKESIQASTIVCILLSIVGLIIMIEPGIFTGQAPALPLFNVSIALVGAFGSAVAYIIVRRLSPLEDASVIIFYFPLAALPLSLILLGDQFVMPNTQALVALILVGISTQVGQLGLTHAMRTETAGKAAAYSYIQVIFAVPLGWVFFAELPSVWTWIGGGLIVFGALLNLARR